MPVSFSYSVIPGSIKRSRRTQPSYTRSAVLSKPLAAVQQKMCRDEPERRQIPLGRLYHGHDCSCCPIHESESQDRPEEEGTPRAWRITPHLPRPYRAYTTERTYFPSVPYSDTGIRYRGSPSRTHDQVLDVNRQPHKLHNGHARYPDEVIDRRLGHRPAFPELHSVRSDVTRTRRSSFDTAVSEHRPSHAFHASSNVVPMEFKAAANKLFSVLQKAEKFLDTFLRSFKQETAAAYMDRTSEWRRKVDRYNRDLVLPNPKPDGPHDSYRGDDETPAITVKDTFDELQAQIQKHVQQLSWSRSQKPASCHHHVNHDRQPGEEHDFRLPDDATIKLEVQHEVAQALLRSVESVQPQLRGYVKRMDQDYIAAWEALSMIKKLRRVLDQYRRGWRDAEEDQSED